MTATHRHQLLVVDDDREFAEELAELLDCYECDVAIAETVAEAQAAMAAGQYRFAVLDIGLGTESGLSLAHEWLGRSDLRLLLLSGRRLTPTEAASFAGDAPQLLLKPASGSAILQALGIDSGS